jgi:hypothetical protein
LLKRSRNSADACEELRFTTLSACEHFFFLFSISIAEFGHGWKSLKMGAHDILRKGCKK